MKVVINPKYKELEGFINGTIDSFKNSGEIIYSGRNVLKVFYHKGINVNIKSFRIPNMINKIVYKYFRASKAKHSFDYAMRLVDLNINTPEPIAYIEQFSNALFSKSFYLSINADYDYTIRDVVNTDKDFNPALMRSFTAFMFDIHNKGVVHKDLSPGNILIKEKDGDFIFSIVDINRMQFKSLSFDDRINNFSKLWANDKVLSFIAKEYALLASYNEDKTIERILLFDSIHKKKKLRKKYIKDRIRGKKHE